MNAMNAPHTPRTPRRSILRRPAEERLAITRRFSGRSGAADNPLRYAAVIKTNPECCRATAKHGAQNVREERDRHCQLQSPLLVQRILTQPKKNGERDISFVPAILASPTKRLNSCCRSCRIQMLRLRAS
ncbi:hypothetical protein V5799_019105 [Amblyomma americanum]|uniref:Uncharacterized protein n=1 Tax=Amblyomma americanum TaxID=6943 RepID=A0AAQ4EXB0_AMBAM